MHLAIEMTCFVFNPFQR